MTDSHADYSSAVATIRQKTDSRPKIGLVLGSGLGGLADHITDRVVIPYEEIPGWPRSTVHGHQGQLVIGQLEGQPVIAQQGRAHFYEGYTIQQVTFPIRVMHQLGVDTLFLTNAAGGLNENFTAGDVMLLNDHINMPGLTGLNPLIGRNDDDIGPRFLGMSQTYDRDLRELARDVALSSGITLHEGVYICLSGPTFETPAENRLLRLLGGDAVGMSTAPEVIVARHAGMRVMACSGITNKSIFEIDSDFDTNHEEVLEAGHVIVPRLMTILKGVLRRLN
ncbi:MAG: purine-nucleoside phosphorylase [Anaerolineaceae bacterium]|nr:MAG: purine-nucleoside phosphorylase [Anaerolineaceae bacterium]